MKRVFRPLSLILLLASALAAQDAGIQGVVTDQSGALVAGAQITITNLDTGLHRVVESNEVGFYTAPRLPVGRYKVTTTKAGFGPSERPEIKLDVQQTARIDFVLKPGALAESIEVTAAAALLDSETSTVGQVIDNKRIAEMPLNGRNYLELARLAAGAGPAIGGRNADEGGFSASGQHSWQVQVTVDGVDNTSVSSGGPLGFETQAVKPSLDAVGEFRVVTNNLSAEYGYRMGGQVFVNIKSGTNQLHGTAFEFLRNDKFDGTNFFANRSGAGKPEYRQNQFGATLGGPIRKDKTFLFGSYEGRRIRLGQSSVSTVPTVAERTGDFSAIRNIFDPQTTTGTGATMARQPFPRNFIPQSRWDPLFPKLLTLYPLPTDAVHPTGNYFYSPVESTTNNSYDFKGDHNFSDTSHLYLRYSRRDKFDFLPGTLPLPGDGGAAQTTDILAHSVVASHTKTFGTTLTNELRFGFTRMVTKFDIPYDKPLFGDYGIKGIPQTTFPSSNDHGLTRFSAQGYVDIGSRSNWPNQNNLDNLQFYDTAFKSLGKHSIKFGGEYRRENIFRSAARVARGQMVFNREFTANPQSRGNTGDGLAEFMLGWPSGGQTSNEQGETTVARTFAAFVQDDWKISPRLTLNLGLRYDLFFAPTFPQSAVSTFLVDYAHAGPDVRFQQIRPKSDTDCLCDQDLNNFGPRIGLAYRAGKGTVIRSGFGVIFAQADALNTQVARARNQAPDQVQAQFNTVDRINPIYRLQDGFPLVPLKAGDVPGPALVAIQIQDRYYPTQYSQQWFFDVQRELPHDALVTFGYNGNGTRQLSDSIDINNPFGPAATSVASRRIWPFYNAVNHALSMGNLSYNALTVKVEKRFSRGLQFLSAFTWAHSIDNVDEDNTKVTGDGPVFPYNHNLNRGNSAMDIRRLFTTSAVYELPFGKGKRWLNRGGVLDAVLGGWQLGGILTLRTGQTFTVTDQGGITNSGGADRPNRIGDGQLTASQQSIDRWFDVSAFQVQPQYTYGNAGRNILFGPGLRNLDFSLAKSFRLSEKKRLQFRAESFNFSNTPAFGLPNAVINGPGPGVITSAGDPRRVQFGLKFVM
jgi:hypothetical protein